jgi:outer membrane protein assembly factor BamB
MRRYRLVAVVVPLVLTASGCWLQPRVEAGNTNFVALDPELSAATVGGLVQLWATDLTTAELVVGEVAAPLSINDDVYVAANSFTEPIDAMSAALDADTGTVRWSTPLDVPVSPFRADLYDPAWFEGDLLVPYVELDPAISAGGSFSVDPATGVATNAPFGGGHLAVVGDHLVSQTITVIRQPPPAMITRVDGPDFDPVWGATTAPLRQDYAVVGDRIAWVDGTGGASGYSAACGGQADPCFPDWRTPLGGGVVSSPTALGTEQVVYTDTSGRVYVLDMATGAIAWQADLGSQGALRQATVTPDAIVVGTSDGRVVALPASGCGGPTCPPLWRGAAGHAVTSVVVAGDVAYAATSDGSIVAFDMAGCAAAVCDPLVTVSVGAGRFITGGPIVHDGRVIAGTADGRVVAFGLAD